MNGTLNPTEIDPVNRWRLDRPAVQVAPDLLGARLVSSIGGETVHGLIVETEAYCEDDPASHSYNGVTPRSRPMFGPPGHWYIYRCYGIHWMANIVCGDPGEGEAVLLRAVEPVEGLETIRCRRGQQGTEVTNGPGKLAEALAITDTVNADPLSPETGLYLQPGADNRSVYQSPRVGIQEAAERPWRFFWESKYRSKVKQNDAARRRN